MCPILDRIDVYDAGMSLFRDRYRIETIRFPGRDYGRGLFFVTMCTRQRVRNLSSIHHGNVVLTDIGSIVADEWCRTAIIRPYVSLDAWVIMPDHIHGIIHIDRDPHDPSPVETPRRGVSTTFKNNTVGHKLEWHSGCLGASINQFKMSCTKRIRGAGHTEFAWQPRYYECIIRSPEALDAVRRYIRNNPREWRG